MEIKRRKEKRAKWRVEGLERVKGRAERRRYGSKKKNKKSGTVDK